MNRTALFLLTVASLHLGAPNGALGSKPLHSHRSRKDVEAGIVHRQHTGTPAAEAPSVAPAASRPVSIGFASSRKLHEAVRERLMRKEGYRVDPSQQIPADPAGLFITGHFGGMKADHGWLECSARYMVAGQPGLTVMLLDRVEARVPILPGSTAAQRREAQDIAEAGCLSEMAQKMTDGLQRAGG